jgi:hypothetical protein
VANRLSPTLRQSLLLHEVVHSCNKPQKPVVGEPISADAIQAYAGRRREFIEALRETTLSLGEKA